MSRNSKIFLFAVISSFSGWVIGTTLIGIADVTYLTDKGIVDMGNQDAIFMNFNDPSLTAIVSWGSITLKGIHWTYSFPIILAAVTFVSVYLLSTIRKNKK